MDIVVPRPFYVAVTYCYYLIIFLQVLKMGLKSLHFYGKVINISKSLKGIQYEDHAREKIGKPIGLQKENKRKRAISIFL